MRLTSCKLITENYTLLFDLRALPLPFHDLHWLNEHSNPPPPIYIRFSGVRLVRAQIWEELFLTRSSFQKSSSEEKPLQTQRRDRHWIASLCSGAFRGLEFSFSAGG